MKAPPFVGGKKVGGIPSGSGNMKGEESSKQAAEGTQMVHKVSSALKNTFPLQKKRKKEEKEP